MAPSGKQRSKGRCGVFAGKTVWCTVERLRGEVLTTRRIQIYVYLYLYLCHVMPKQCLEFSLRLCNPAIVPEHITSAVMQQARHFHARVNFTNMSAHLNFTYKHQVWHDALKITDCNCQLNLTYNTAKLAYTPMLYINPKLLFNSLMYLHCEL